MTLIAASPRLSQVSRDFMAGTIVFLVTAPICVGLAAVANAPPFAGILSGIVGGLLVGLLSGSQISVSGPAVGLTAVMVHQTVVLGSYEAFLLAVVFAGLIQIALGVVRIGYVSAFVPSSVIRGLLAAIGVILILKQLPHVLGHDTDPEGEMSFWQPDHETTLSEIGRVLGDMHWAAAAIGIGSFALLLAFDTWRPLRKIRFAGPFVVVILGVAANLLLRQFEGRWTIGESHLIQVPIAKSLETNWQFLRMPDWHQWTNPAVYWAAVTLAIAGSLETLVNLEAIDTLDAKKRHSPPSRELRAQGMGNMVVGLLGGIPMTTLIVPSAVNVHAGSQSKLSTIVHGLLLAIMALFFASLVNLIPIASVAAVLMQVGGRLVQPLVFVRVWREGRYQFIPFLVTLLAVVFTDLWIGIVVGLAVSLAFILNSNLRRPLRRIVEKHVGGEVLRIELANQVSFLNRGAIENALRTTPPGTHLLLDAQNTDYIDPDILSLIRDFKDNIAPVHGIQLSLKGFRDKYQLDDAICYVDYSTRDLQDQLTSAQVLRILQEGNERFRTGARLTRDLGRQLHATAAGQHPLAVVLSCIDSRTPAELVFDLGLGDIFSVRVAGNITSPKVLGSIEYGCAVAGAKLVLVMGHTRCGAVSAAVNLAKSHQDAAQATGCQHIESIVDDIQRTIDPALHRRLQAASTDEVPAISDDVARRNVLRVVRQIAEGSETIARLLRERRVAVVGAIYDVSTGELEFLLDGAIGLPTHAESNGRPEHANGSSADDSRSRPTLVGGQTSETS